MTLTATTARSPTAFKLRAIALDFDGTIADEGQVQADVRAAILDARARGIAVVLVTGRILNDLRCEGVDLALFDAIVAENGSVLAFPKAGRSSVLGTESPERFVSALRERGVDQRRIQGHLRRGDLSQWIEDVVRDHALAASVSALEGRARLGQLPDFSGAVIRAVSDRYGLPDAYL